jgi:XTP/dITP diphosphohydrolase
MALATPAGLVDTVEGHCEGVIALAPRGHNGFGYDPVFFLPRRGMTMAQLSQTEKHAISHRGQAGRAARSLLARWLSAAPAGQ